MSGISSSNKKKKFANFDVSFSSSIGDSITVHAIVTGGGSPYKYNWSVSEQNLPCHFFVSSTTGSYVSLDTIGPNSSILSAINARKKFSTTLRLDVSDRNSITKSFYYNFSSTKYPINPSHIPNFNREVTASYMADADTELVPFVFEGVNFLDDIRFVPQNEELDGYACPESFISSIEFGSEWDTSFRMLRNELYEQQRSHLRTYGASEYTPDYESFALTGSKSIYNKGPLKNINLIFGPQYYKYSYFWNLPLEALGGDSFADRLGATGSINQLPDIADPVDLPSTGSPGDYIIVRPDGEYSYSVSYIWDPTIDGWNETLGNELNSIYVDRRARRDAHVYNVNELVLSIRPFIAANIYLPLHRIKKEKI